MGPRLKVTPEEFLKIVTQEQGLVIKGPKMAFAGTTYLTHSGDYYYYTTTKKWMEFPDGTRLSEALGILL